ncbi:MAG: hypothetical protein E3K37_00375 [Candidatus Kuenenia sp.]|nr:hypothetical protein [Candidatus Kuenenia hertensis]
MIISKRIKIPRDDIDSTQLLEYILEYFRNNITGVVLRFAIVGVSTDDLVVDASIKVKDTVTKRNIEK